MIPQSTTPTSHNLKCLGVFGFPLKAIKSISQIRETRVIKMHTTRRRNRYADSARHQIARSTSPPSLRCFLSPNEIGNLSLIVPFSQHVYSNSGEFDLWRFTFSSASLDTGFLPLAARELKAKLKSRQAVYEAAGLGIDQVVIQHSSLTSQKAQMP